MNLRFSLDSCQSLVRSIFLVVCCEEDRRFLGSPSNNDDVSVDHVYYFLG